MTERQKRVLRTKASKQDDSIMGTNSSSITSKRSVERIYFPKEPQFFRHFVKKPQRRAPLINRGYWLRMKAIDYVVRQFLEQPSGKPKVVVNLGCGYDPLPWQCISRYPELCKNVKFIDIDYEDLMLKKREIVSNAIELKGILTNVLSGESPLLLQSDQYVQIACDLRDLSTLSTALSSVIDLDATQVMFSAEVSITYMTVTAADELIKWAGTIPDARFCLLEQIMPGGIDHPFAKTMMAHFRKLQTPLGSISKYPTTEDQEIRFETAGWIGVKAINLWELWASSDLSFLTSEQRISLDKVEAFDEWEEFALFACHYSLLVAENGTPSGFSLLKLPKNNITRVCLVESRSANLTCVEYQQQNGCRRFAAPIRLRSSNRQQDLIGNFAGMGLNTRLNSCDAYMPSTSPLQLLHPKAHTDGPSSRMCHTITDLDEVGAILIGGRTSPDSALVDCWLYHKWNSTWERIDDLPTPRYRHTSISIGSGRVLVAGGKTNSTTLSEDYLIWDRLRGWVTVGVFLRKDILDAHLAPRFGAILSTMSSKTPSNKVSGILAGGMSRDGLILEDFWSWDLTESEGTLPILVFKREDPLFINRTAFARFGANALNHQGSLVIIGGINRDKLLLAEEEVICVDMSPNSIGSRQSQIRIVKIELSGPRPLMIGISAAASEREIVIMGGGAVCFSFGTYWNNGCYTLSFHHLADSMNQSGFENGASPSLGPWRYLESTETTSLLRSMIPVHEKSSIPSTESCQLASIKRVKITSSAEFTSILLAAQPVVLENMDLGNCTKKWNSEYLKQHIGGTKEVTVHQATQEHMSFISKNFKYVTKPFGGFMDAIESGDKLYLRSLSAEKPSEVPADLSRDFPAIAGDFHLPRELDTVIKSAHSSPLRISGPVNMWLHYDVMANILCQIRGSKRILLFPPDDLRFLDFAPGASSSDIDVFKLLDSPKLAQTSPQEAVLQPGDILFLPALWLHAASPKDTVSIAVNVFFRDLQQGYAPGRDIYGNRDLQAYEKGRLDVARISKSFDNLPTVVRHFYMQRLAEELRQKV